MNLRTQSFATEWLLLATSLAVLGGFIAYWIAEEHAGIEMRERSRLSTQAQVIHDGIERQLDGIRRAEINIRDELADGRSRLPAQNALLGSRLRAFAGAMPGVRTMAVIDADGKVIAASRDELLGSDFHERAYFMAVQQRPEKNLLYVSPPFKTALGIWSLNVVTMVPGRNGEFAGIVAATLDPEEFALLLNSVLYAKDMWASIAHGGGLQFLMEPDRPGQTGKNLVQPGSFFTRHLESGRGANVLTGIVYATGEQRMMALRTVQPPALHMDVPLVVAVGRDIDAMYAPWRHDMWAHGSLFALLVFTSIPALRLLQQRRRIAQGEADAAAMALREKSIELERLNTQLQAQSEQLRAQAYLDGLTGVANRRRFDDALDAEWRRCRRDGAPLALLMIDIDHFKLFNDRYGHQAGDDCLKTVARTLKEGFGRSHDLVARYGGEEFVCLMPDCGRDGAQAKAESLRIAVEQLAIPHESSSTARMVTLSIGVATRFPDGAADTSELIAAADAALYVAKKDGRNRVVAAA